MGVPTRSQPLTRRAPRKLSPAALLAVVGSLMTMAALATDVMLPAFPVMAESFGVDEATIQQVISVFMLGYALPQLLIGSLSDRFGRRPVLLGGLLVYFVGSLICLLAPSLALLLAGRFVQGLGCAVGTILARAVLRDQYRGAQLARMMSFAMIVFSGAPLLAPSIGALIMRFWSWEANFAFLLLVAVILTALVLFVLPETLAEVDEGALKPKGIAASVRSVLGEPSSAWSLAFLTLVYGGLVAYLLAAPTLFITHYGLKPSDFALVFALIATVTLLSQPLNVWLLRRYDPGAIAGVAVPGYLLSGALMLALALAGLLSLPLFVGGMVVFFASFSLIMGNGTTMLLDPHQRRAGVASGLMGFVQIALGTALGSLIARFAVDGPLALAAGFTLLGLLAYPAFRIARRSRERAAERLT